MEFPRDTIGTVTFNRSQTVLIEILIAFVLVLYVMLVVKKKNTCHSLNQWAFTPVSLSLKLSRPLYQLHTLRVYYPTSFIPRVFTFSSSTSSWQRICRRLQKIKIAFFKQIAGAKTWYSRLFIVVTENTELFLPLKPLACKNVSFEVFPWLIGNDFLPSKTNTTKLFWVDTCLQECIFCSFSMIYWKCFCSI